MCLILLAHRVDPKYPFVLAANRDEFFARPTRQAQFWDEQPSTKNLLAGKDLELGGTWLGINKQGRFAAVTNIRDPSQQSKPPRSRGELCLNFLKGSESAQQYLQSLQGDLHLYAGFNLLIGDGDKLFYLHNHGVHANTSSGNKFTELPPGVYGLSNGLLNAPWPKISKGVKGLQNLIDQSGEPSTDSLIALMQDRQQADDNELPETGVSLELERQLSPAFISNPQRQYGSRCSSAIIVDDKRQMRFSELNYDSRGEPTERHFYRFKLAH